MNENYFVIIVDQATESEIDNIHSIVKKNTDSWWHHFEATWIVKGLSAKQWRDELSKFLTGGYSSLLIFQLSPKVEDRNWSFIGPDAKLKCDWLHREIL